MMRQTMKRKTNPAPMVGLVCVLGWVLATTSACSVVKAANQPDKKDLAVFSTGTPRSHVIAEIGAPTWSEEEKGTRTDVFAFTQGYSKGAKVGRAFFHGAADVVTLGLWEVVAMPVETIADGKEMKVQVSYDVHDRIQKVSYFHR